MSVNSLQIIALQNITIGQVMKAERSVKRVVSHHFISAAANPPTSQFNDALIAAGNHPCRMKSFRVWHGNWKLSKSGKQIERKPLEFRNRSLCVCSCVGTGNVCECECAAVIKMAAEFKMRSVFFDRKGPMVGFRINPEMTISELL